MNIRMFTRTAVALWRDERGFVMSAELILYATIAVIGLIVGLATYRGAVVQELGDTAAAVGALNQSYALQVTSGDPASGISVAGTQVTVSIDFGLVTQLSTFENYSYTDLPDLCDVAQAAGTPPAGISLTGPLEEDINLAMP